MKRNNNLETEEIFDRLASKAMRMLLEKEGLISTEQSQETKTVDSEEKEG